MSDSTEPPVLRLTLMASPQEQPERITSWQANSALGFPAGGWVLNPDGSVTCSYCEQAIGRVQPDAWTHIAHGCDTMRDWLLWCQETSQPPAGIIGKVYGEGTSPKWYDSVGFDENPADL